MQAVILAGGRGTRLDPKGEAPPKPLMPLMGQPLLEHLISWLAHQGVKDMVLCTGYRAHMVEEAIGNGDRWGVTIRYSAETQPLGTAGAVRAAAVMLKSRFFVVYGDVLADVDLSGMAQRHVSTGAVATLAVHPNDHPLDSDRVVTNRHGVITRMVRKEDKVGPEAGGLCNAALYLCEKSVLDAVPLEGTPDFARDVFPAAIKNGARLVAYRTAEYLKDMGTPARLAKVEEDLRAGIPWGMRRSASRPAVLLDRDGVLLEEVAFLSNPDELKLLPGVAGAIAQVNKARWLAAAVTNQPVVARGTIDEDGLHTLHTLMEGKLGEGGAWLDDIFTCPHHTDKGFPGERADLKIHCTCRKPLPGLVFQAEAALGVDRRASIFVGDRSTDLLAAHRAGVLGVGVLTGMACKDGKHPIAPETPLVPTLQHAVNLALRTGPSWEPWLADIQKAGVVLLGGPSRAGKTIAASALKLRLQARGVPVLHLSLDRFVQPASQRSASSTLRQRLCFDDAARAVAALLSGQAVRLPGYDPQTREAGQSQMMLWPSNGGVLILEGLLATELDVVGAFKVALTAQQDVLRERRVAFYRWKGLAEKDLDAAVDGRAEEHETVAAAAARATLKLRLDGDLRLERDG